MIPLYLQLINFMSHENTEIVFGNISVACIQGPNGAGKSAIADSILYALYGITSRGRDNDIVRLGCNEMTVIYDFEQVQHYRIIRKKNITGRGKTVAELYSRDSASDQWLPLATGEAAKEKILEILNRDFNTFISSSFLLQGQGERLINARPSERYKVVFDILGLDKYTDYKKKATSLKNKTEGQKTALVESVADLVAQAGNISEIESLKQASEAELKTVTDVLASKEQLLMQHTSELAVLSSKIKELDAVSESLVALEREKADLALKKYDLESSVRPVDAELEPHVREMLQGLREKENGIQEAMDRLADMRARKSAAEEIEKDISSLEMKRASVLKGITETENHAERYRKILENKEKILNLLEEEKSVTHQLHVLRKDCENTLSEIESHNLNLRKASETESRISKVRAEITTKEKDREHETRTVRDRIKQAEKKSSLVNQAFCKGEGDYATCMFIKDALDARDSLASLNEQLEKLGQPLDIPEMKELESLNGQLASLSPDKLKETIKQENEGVSRMKADISGIEKRLEVISTWTKQAPEIKTAEIELDRANKSVDQARRELFEVEERLRALASRKEEMKDVGRQTTIAEAVIERLNVAAEIKVLQKKLDEVSRDVDEMKKKESSLAETRSSLHDLERQVSDLRSSVEALRNEEKKTLAEISKLDVEISSCRQAAERVRSFEADIAKLSHRHRVLQILEEAYEKIPFYILDNVIPIMEEESNKILEEISTTGMRLELRTEKTNKSNKNIKDTLDIIVSDTAGERPIEMYSGGEKTRQILALAVGLAELSARKAGVKISTLLIDEPSGLDKQGLVDFGRAFIKLVESNVFKKGMLMAHEEILREIFDQKILVRKEGTTSRVEMLI